MTFITKLDVLIARQNLTKPQFAAKAGITYRALAYFMSGERKPRKNTLDKMATVLGVTPEFLTNDNAELELTAEEKFMTSLEPKCKCYARHFITSTKKMFANTTLSTESKDALYDCLSEIRNKTCATGA